MGHEHDRLNEFMREVRASLAQIKYNQQRIIQGESAMSLDLSKLQSEMAKQTTIVAGVKTFIGTLLTQISALSQSTTDPSTQSALDSLASQLSANDDALAASIVVNTGTTVAPTTP